MCVVPVCLVPWVFLPWARLCPEGRLLDPAADASMQEVSPGGWALSPQEHGTRHTDSVLVSLPRSVPHGVLPLVCISSLEESAGGLASLDLRVSAITVEDEDQTL